MSNITYKPHCNYARMTCAHNYAQCCDGVGGEKAWSTLASASGGGRLLGVWCCCTGPHWADVVLCYTDVWWPPSILSILHTPWWLYDAVVNVSSYVCM